MEFCIHLLLQLAGLLGSDIGEVGTVGGEDDTTRGVDEKSAVSIHTIQTYFFETAALCSNTWNKKKMVGNNLADVFKHLALCGSYHIHHVVFCAPLLRGLQNLLKQALAIGILHQLEVVRPLVRSQCQKNNPLVFVAKEGRNAVFTHIGGHGEGVYL